MLGEQMETVRLTNVTGDNLLALNPDDIESMTVLKGAAAALYGQGGNGAIITASGSKGSTWGRFYI